MKTFYSKLQTIVMMVLFTFVSIQAASASAKAGEATVFEGSTVTIALADAYKRTLMQSTGVTYQWYSESNSYATVTSSTRYNATVKGIKATSSCKVYFKCSYFIDGFYRTMDFYYVITVKPTNISVTNVSLSRSSASVTEGNTLQLTATVYPTNATNRNVTWSSSNTSVASVSSYGLVSAKSAGTATITCRAADGSGKYATCLVTVEPSTVYVSAISLNMTSALLDKGETVQLSASVSPSTATNRSVSWTSDNTSVATVSASGLITAQSAGNATITCKAKDGSGKYATCLVTVREKAAGEPSDWQGQYRVSSKHVVNNPTREYTDNFEMTIEEKEGACYITSMFGNDLTRYNNGGFKLHDNGDGTATVDVSYYNILKYTDNDSPLYTLYVFDDAADDWTDKWILKMNDDGSIALGEFYVAAFSWVEEEEVWKNGQLEALYYSLTAETGNTNHLTEATQEEWNLRVCNGTVILEEAEFVTVYGINGTVAFSGKTRTVENLAKGVYIVRAGNRSKKIAIK